ncbi:MAG: hypothetical protein IJV34_07535 [Prevotella sp.]|nr:hypothetical protein [Prevotella sp.]
MLCLSTAASAEDTWDGTYYSTSSSFNYSSWGITKTTVDDVEWYHFTTAKQLATYADYVTHWTGVYNSINISLDADINLNNYPWLPLRLGGNFKGNGHTIRGLNVTGEEYVNYRLYCRRHYHSG